MHFSTSTLLAAAGMASAQTLHVVSVSGEGDWALKFSPDNIKAPVGDMIQFQFRAGNHSVVQSSFDSPCAPMAAPQGDDEAAAGFYSGYQPVAASEAMGMIPTYTIMVQDEKPMWVYCSQGKHCQAGMTMVINEDPATNSSRTLNAYREAASAVPESSAGGDAAGGDAGTAPEPDEGAGDDAAAGGDDAAAGGDDAAAGGDDAAAGGDDAAAGGDDAAAGGDASTGDDAAAGGDASTGTPTGDAEGAEEGASSPSTTPIEQAGANMVAVSSSMGLVGLAAALFLL